MILRNTLFIALGFAAFASQAQAACDVKSFDGHSLSRCKVWPAFKNQAIGAKATFVPDADDKEVGVFDLDLTIIHSLNGKTLVTYRKPGAFNSDAIGFEDLRIDTARYKLAEGVRAFGLRSEFAGHSSPNPYSKNDLALYVRDGNKLRPVLEGLVVYKNSGDWMSECEGQATQIRRTLDIGKTSHHGFADLIITTGGTVLKNVKSGQECLSKTTDLKKTQITLTYDGQQYGVPEALRGY